MEMMRIDEIIKPRAKKVLKTLKLFFMIIDVKLKL